MEQSRTGIVEEVLGRDNRRLQKLAAQGLLPLPLEELLPLQVALTWSEDEEIARTATESLHALEPRVVANFLSGTDEEVVLAFFARQSSHPVILEAILRKRDTPPLLLAEMAPNLQPELQEALLLRQDAVLEEPSILSALETNPELSSYARRRIAEYREHLLPREKAPAEPSPEEPVDEPTDEEVQAEIEAARGQPAREGDVDEITGLTEAQIRTLPIPVRLKLSRGASRILRAALIRDPNAQVALSVLRNNTLGDSEVEQYASSRAVVDDVLDAIGRQREWIRKYSIIHALVRNPRTPVALAVRYVPRLAVRDLRNLARDRNVPDAVRATAQRLYKIKAK